MRITFYILILTVILTATVACNAAPAPAIVPGANLWTVNVEYTNPEQIMVKIPGQRAPQRFWYIILTMTNKSGYDVPFYPRCDLMTDTLTLTQAYRDTRKRVFKKIAKRYKRKYPFLESLEYADNRILQGEDNTKDMVIIWPDFDLEAKKISLFVAGLSNETVAIDHPTAKNENGMPKKIFLRKTLQLDYAIAGDKALRHKSKLTFKDQTWIMR